MRGFHQHTGLCRSWDAAKAGLMGETKSFENSLNTSQRLQFETCPFLTAFGKQEEVLSPELLGGAKRGLGSVPG